MRSEDFYGPVEFLDVIVQSDIHFQAKWVVRRALGPSGTSAASAVLPDAHTYPQPVGKTVWVTNNGNPDGIGGEYAAGIYGTFDVAYRNAAGTVVSIVPLAYEQTGVFGLKTDGNWALIKRFDSVDFTTPSAGFDQSFRVDITSDVNNIDIDEEITAMGWDGATDCFVEVIVRNGVNVGSLDPSVPALKVELTGTNSRMFLQVEPGGGISGAGGGGGFGGLGGAFPDLGGDGQRGGTAVEARCKLSVINGGLLAGGGGGGAGADGVIAAQGGAGGGGAGVIGGIPGVGGGNPPATRGTALTGGIGGVPPGTGVLGIGGDGGDLGVAGDTASLGAATAGQPGYWLECISFGLPGLEQPIVFATATQDYRGLQSRNLV